MKKLPLLLIAAVLATITGCSDPVEIIDTEYPTDYIFLNESSSEITVHSYNVYDQNGERPGDDLSFVIPVGGAHSIHTWASLPMCFHTHFYSPEDYATISNGEKVITQTRDSQAPPLNDPNNLYDPRNYTTIYDNEPPEHTIRLFVFTDEFFENVDPIIP